MFNRKFLNGSRMSDKNVDYAKLTTQYTTYSQRQQGIKDIQHVGDMAKDSLEFFYKMIGPVESQTVDEKSGEHICKDSDSSSQTSSGSESSQRK